MKDERSDDCQDFSEEQHVLLGVLLMFAVTLAKITLKKIDLLFRKLSAPDSCFKPKKGQFCSKLAH